MKGTVPFLPGEYVILQIFSPSRPGRGLFLFFHRVCICRFLEPLRRMKLSRGSRCLFQMSLFFILEAPPPRQPIPEHLLLSLFLMHRDSHVHSFCLSFSQPEVLRCRFFLTSSSCRATLAFVLVLLRAYFWHVFPGGPLAPPWPGAPHGFVRFPAVLVSPIKGQTAPFLNLPALFPSVEFSPVVLPIFFFLGKLLYSSYRRFCR